jgi:hypothetical protein
MECTVLYRGNFVALQLSRLISHVDVITTSAFSWVMKVEQS